MEGQNNLRKKSYSSKVMKENNIEDILIEETRKLVGYVMPILEAEGISITSKSNIKSILWNYKDNLQEKLFKESYERRNQG
jgi:hypothetical protein